MASASVPSPWPISIHALREEGDGPCRWAQKPTAYFYPRPPRGGRLVAAYIKKASTKFLSTPSARRATRGPSVFCRCGHISIHALREEGDIEQYNALVHRLDISIHALREEGDLVVL